MEAAKAKIEIIKYLSEILEKPMSEFGGLPPCPFARYERISGKLYIGVYDPGISEFTDHVVETMINPGHASGLYALFIDGEPEEMEPDLTYKFQCFLNSRLAKNNLSEYRVICFNPKQDFTVANFNVRQKSPFFLINVAKRDILYKANLSLSRTDYYNNFSESYINYLTK